MFSDFHGNVEVVTRLRQMLGRGRLPHGVILAGPEGAGKYTLAQLLTKAMNCLDPPKSKDGLPDFCGRCANCVRIAQADDLKARFEEAVEAREGLRDTDKRETRIFVQTHPDVIIIPPDPPQMMIKVDQVRRVIASIYLRPAEARERVYTFTDAAFMKEAANALLKVLEEPPEYATLFLLAENAGALLPTIRSRCVTFTLAPLRVAELEKYLEKARPELNVKQRALVARLANGAVGKARTFDLAAYVAARQDALTLLDAAAGESDHSALFQVTERYRAGAEGKEKTQSLISTIYSLLEDVMLLKSGAADLVRNQDVVPQLRTLGERVDFEWLSRAAQRLGEVESGMRRNLLRSLSLDAWAVSAQEVLGR
jgi:DNA polymerase III subunit delta'